MSDLNYIIRDQSIVDVDFQQEASRIPGFLGTLVDDPQERMCGGDKADFGADWMWDRGNWDQRINEIEQKKVALPTKRTNNRYNQSPESSCVLNATGVAFMLVRNSVLGTQWHVEVSPMSVYGPKASGRNSGYTMWGALQLVKADNGYGFLPVDTDRQKQMFNHTMHENTPFTRNMPDGHMQTRKHFTVVEWYPIDSREQFASAVLNLWPIVYGRSGHSICACQLVKSGGKYYIKYLDSYGHGRGEDGYLLDSERMWSTGGAWACREVTLPDVVCCPAGQDGCDLDMVTLAKLWGVDESIIETLCA